jgi:hypothetical protein
MKINKKTGELEYDEQTLISDLDYIIKRFYESLSNYLFRDFFEAEELAWNCVYDDDCDIKISLDDVVYPPEFYSYIRDLLVEDLKAEINSLPSISRQDLIKKMKEETLQKHQGKTKDIQLELEF